MKIERSNRLTEDEKVVVTMMAMIKLERGTMLLLGPQSVEILRSGRFAGVLPDKYVIPKQEWNR